MSTPAHNSANESISSGESASTQSIDDHPSPSQAMKARDEPKEPEDDENEDFGDADSCSTTYENRDLSELELQTHLAQLEAAIDAVKKKQEREDLINRIAVRQAELASLQQRPAHVGVPQPNTSTPTRVSRLSVSTPFTNGRPDFYLAGIRRPHRRTLSFVNTQGHEPEQSPDHVPRRPQSINQSISKRETSDRVEERHDHSHSCTIDTRANHRPHSCACPNAVEKPVSVPVPMPQTFTGDGADSIKERALFRDFIDEIEGYVSYSYTSKGQTPTERDWLETAVRFLKGSAQGVYRDLLVMAREEMENGDRDHELTWAELREALIDQFGRPQDGYELILTMFEMKQEEKETIRQFPIVFMRLIWSSCA
jgi:hypothetical protein